MIVRPLRQSDKCICRCRRRKGGKICVTKQYKVYFEALPAAIVTSLVCSCKKVTPIRTGSTRFYINGRPLAHQHSFIPCNKPIPSTIRTYVPI